MYKYGNSVSKAVCVCVCVFKVIIIFDMNGGGILQWHAISYSSYRSLQWEYQSKLHTVETLCH